MLFNTTNFFVFLVVVLALFHASPQSWRRYILLAASYFFYGSWNPKFIALLLTLTIVDYTAGRWIEKLPPGRKRKAALIFSLCANLGFLGFFKYYNFLAGNLAWLMGKPGDSFFLDIVLPLGISFHTFQSMSYVVDVYRGEQTAVRDPIDYALFICFFPQLVAGPIVRAQLLPRPVALEAAGSGRRAARRSAAGARPGKEDGLRRPVCEDRQRVFPKRQCESRRVDGLERRAGLRHANLF